MDTEGCMYAPDAQKILVGNKCEPDVIRLVTFAEARVFGEQLGLTLVEVSVKLRVLKVKCQDL